MIVLCLGAGIAGVTAARNLQKNGLHVLLLEGSDRVGGRIYSKRNFVRDKQGNFIPVEDGAEYIHVKGHRVFMPIQWERYEQFNPYGEWIDYARFGKKVVPSWQIGVLCGGDMRVYQLDPYKRLYH
jgi:flavin-dependent dehydrogenase